MGSIRGKIEEGEKDALRTGRNWLLSGIFLVVSIVGGLVAAKLDGPPEWIVVGVAVSFGALAVVVLLAFIRLRRYIGK
jgi:hypothetical protein